MREMMIYERLDKIERTTFTAWENSEAFDIMLSFVKQAEDLSLLVDRYGSSRSLNLVGYLAELLAQKAGTPNWSIYPLLVAFIKQFHCKNEPGILQCCLRAFWKCIICEENLLQLIKINPFPFSFLRQCLDYPISVKGGLGVPGWTSTVLRELARKNLLDEIGTQTQLAWLYEKLAHLVIYQDHTQDLVENCLYLTEYLRKKTYAPTLKLLLDRFGQASQLFPLLGEEQKQRAELQRAELEPAFPLHRDDLWLLIESYGHPQNPTVTRTLSFLLERHREALGADLFCLLLSFLQKVYNSTDERTLVTCLVLLQHQTDTLAAWIPGCPSPILYPFLRHCITYCLQQPETEYSIKKQLLRLFSLLGKKDSVRNLFSLPECSVLFEQLVHLTSSSTEISGEEAEWSRYFLTRDAQIIRQPIFDQLSLAEREQAVPPRINDTMLDLMIAFACDDKDVQLLIDTYGGSSSDAMVLTLAFFLQKKAFSPFSTITVSILIFFEKAYKRRRSNILAYCVRAFKQQIVFNHLWEPIDQPPQILYTFLLECFQYSNNVKYEALEVLLLLYQKGFLEEIFQTDQLRILSEKATKAVGKRINGLTNRMGPCLLDMIKFLEKIPPQNS